MDSFFSGRIAIETVLREIPMARKAVLPSYCCDSMIDPYRKIGIEIEFYSVNFYDALNIDVTIPDDADILVWRNYFGCSTMMPEVTDFLRLGGFLIEDITYSLLSKRLYDPQSRYIVASVRKWEPINCGGDCASVDGELYHLPITLYTMV